MTDNTSQALSPRATSAANSQPLGKRIEIPHHTVVSQPWNPESGPRENREFTRFEAYGPPKIASLEVSVPGSLIAECEIALDEISRLDAEFGTHLAPLSGMMLRTEAVATSKIKDEHATVEDYLGAFYGNRSNRSAIAMVHATDAIEYLVKHGISNATLLESHRRLMANAGLGHVCRQIPEGAELDCRFGPLSTGCTACSATTARGSRAHERSSDVQ